MKTFSSRVVGPPGGATEMRRHSAFTLLQSLLAGVALVASACSSPAATPAPTAAGSGSGAAQPTAAAAKPAAAASTQPVEMRFAWWGSQDRHNRTIKVI